MRGQALDLSVFPSLLLLLTLYRLSLNIATTRLILLDADAGKIVSTFGGMVVGGNLIVGLVIFLILVVIQFIVITKGAGRISEVAARFTLNAMPGKQMAIDAELNAGVLNEAGLPTPSAARAGSGVLWGDGRRWKFVRGDAIAGADHHGRQPHRWDRDGADGRHVARRLAARTRYWQSATASCRRSRRRDHCDHGRHSDHEDQFGRQPRAGNRTAVVCSAASTGSRRRACSD
ncbi:MAG: FHIPEP family type III secretion protein [Planctomycetaceae bacterium]